MMNNLKISSNPKAESTWDMVREIRKRYGGERNRPWFTEHER